MCKILNHLNKGIKNFIAILGADKRLWFFSVLYYPVYVMDQSFTQRFLWNIYKEFTVSKFILN